MVSETCWSPDLPKTLLWLYGLHQNKKYFLSKYMPKKNLRPPEWEKILATHLPDNWFVCRLYEELLHVNNKKTKAPIKKTKGKILMGIHKKICEWSISSWKDVHHHWPFGKYKLKPRQIPLQIKRLTMPNASKDVGQLF